MFNHVFDDDQLFDHLFGFGSNNWIDGDVV